MNLPHVFQALHNEREYYQIARYFPGSAGSGGSRAWTKGGDQSDMQTSHPPDPSNTMAGFRDARAARAKRSGWCRSGLPYAIVFILFAGLLGSLGLLAHFRSPARRQQLGWQSWDLVQDNTDGKGDVNEALSLPLDTWDPLLPHTTGRECAVNDKIDPSHRDHSVIVLSPSHPLSFALQAEIQWCR